MLHRAIAKHPSSAAVPVHRRTARRDQVMTLCHGPRYKFRPARKRVIPEAAARRPTDRRPTEATAAGDSGSPHQGPLCSLPPFLPPSASSGDPAKRVGPPMTVRSICAECGDQYEPEYREGRCAKCKPRRDYRSEDRLRPEDKRRSDRDARGYDYQWRKLSLRARSQQPWCSDCGRPDDLTADHSAAAWKRKAEGKAIRLQDIDVVCVGCNATRGAARGSNATDEHRGTGTEILEVTVRHQGREG